MILFKCRAYEYIKYSVSFDNHLMNGDSERYRLKASSFIYEVQSAAVVNELNRKHMMNGMCPDRYSNSTYSIIVKR